MRHEDPTRLGIDGYVVWRLSESDGAKHKIVLTVDDRERPLVTADNVGTMRPLISSQSLPIQP